jgi:small multidrug resistance pump
MGYLYLGMAIICEVIGTSALQVSNGFTKIVPSIVVVLGYGLAFYLMSISLRYMPVGIAYAIWAGLGIVLIAIIGAVAFKQIPDLPAITGMGLIILGVLVIRIFSKTAGH